jgi:hypothetical protein
VLVGRSPAILDPRAQSGFDHRSAGYRLAQHAREAGERLRRPLGAAGDQQLIPAGEPSADLERGAHPLVGQGVAVAVGVATQFDVARHTRLSR